MDSTTRCHSVRVLGLLSVLFVICAAVSVEHGSGPRENYGNWSLPADELPSLPNKDARLQARYLSGTISYEACTPEQTSIIEQAWDEAWHLATAHDYWQPPRNNSDPGKYQAVMDMYMGTDSARDYSPRYGDGLIKCRSSSLFYVVPLRVRKYWKSARKRRQERS